MNGKNKRFWVRHGWAVCLAAGILLLCLSHQVTSNIPLVAAVICLLLGVAGYVVSVKRGE